MKTIITALYWFTMWLICIIFLSIQYENEVKIISKWTHNKLSTRPHFSDASGDVSRKWLNRDLHLTASTSTIKSVDERKNKSYK